MTLRASSLSNGLPDKFRVWESFVRLVLEITVEGYQRMRQDGVTQRDWEEDAFTVRLTEDYIRPLAQQHPLNLVTVARTRVHTPAMKAGAVSPKQAPEIDIRLFSSWMNYAQVYFAWECKRVGDKRVNKKYAVLIPGYITEGILRFIDEDYSAGLDDAGMLGYVLAGDVTNIVHDINASMHHPHRARPLSTSDHLVPAPSIGIFVDVYQSHHKRTTSQTAIRLHHLFLTFDFDTVAHCPTTS
jgi:hypothetical protein